MKNFAKINTALLVILLIISCAICFFLWRGGPEVSAPSTGVNAGWDAKKQLDFAETLANKGLKKEALVAFDDYLKIAGISAIEAAKLLYRMGNMYMEILDYEKALYYFYKAEAADPAANFRSQLDEKLVECLENLGMTAHAGHETAQQTSLAAQQKKDSAAGLVVAKVGDEEIMEAEINEAINFLPDWARENFSQGEGKVEFVRQYATTQALYKKAKQLGLQQDAEVQRSVRDVTKQLLVQRFLAKELKDKINVGPADVKAYYETEKDKYKIEATAAASVIKFSNLQKAQDAVRRLGVGADFVKMVSEQSEDEETKKKNGQLEGGIEKNGYIPGIGTSKEAADAIFSKKEGEVAGPFKIADAYYVFKINSVTPETQRPFEEVREQVEYEYKNRKMQEQMQALLKDVLEEQRVEVYADKILGKYEARTDEKKE